MRRKDVAALGWHVKKESPGKKRGGVGVKYRGGTDLTRPMEQERSIRGCWRCSRKATGAGRIGGGDWVGAKTKEGKGE